jgi:hypothetical protein
MQGNSTLTYFDFGKQIMEENKGDKAVLAFPEEIWL